jgi:predicted CXXCH cytochrome family protein
VTEALLREPLRGACIECHDEVIATEAGDSVADIGHRIATLPVVHAPVRDGNCLECHRAHGSALPDLLSARLPAPLYVPYSADAYELCFTCHDPRMIEEERSTITAFRDGDRNLHQVHVRRDKGRTCGLCHDVHASSSPALMKDSVPYGPGGWRLPIAFARTPEGGTCLAGCHQEESYDHRTPPGVKGAHLLESKRPEPVEKD